MGNKDIELEDLKTYNARVKAQNERYMSQASELVKTMSDLTQYLDTSTEVGRAIKNKILELSQDLSKSLGNRYRAYDNLANAIGRHVNDIETSNENLMGELNTFIAGALGTNGFNTEYKEFDWKTAGKLGLGLNKELYLNEYKALIGKAKSIITGEIEPILKKLMTDLSLEEFYEANEFGKGASEEYKIKVTELWNSIGNAQDVAVMANNDRAYGRGSTAKSYMDFLNVLEKYGEELEEKMKATRYSIDVDY